MYLSRKIDQELLQWKGEKDHKPLLIRGARQVGKSTTVRNLARAINEAESEADKIIARAERGLVVEFSAPGARTLEFVALEKLYAMLEEMTDDAKRCGKLIVSLARKEA